MRISGTEGAPAVCVMTVTSLHRHRIRRPPSETCWRSLDRRRNLNRGQEPNAQELRPCVCGRRKPNESRIALRRHPDRPYPRAHLAGAGARCRRPAQPRRRFCDARGGAERRQRRGGAAHRAGPQHSRAHDGEQGIAGLDRRALPRAELEREPQERGGVEGADQQARNRQRRGAGRRAREARRDHGAHRDRRGEGFHPVAEGDPGGEFKTGCSCTCMAAATSTIRARPAPARPR